MSEFFVHETAIVDEGAKVGGGTRIWHFTHIMPDATIGEKCNIGQNVFIASGVNIGNNVKIQNNVSVYEGVICEDDVFLGPSCVFTNIKNPRSAIIRKGQYAKTIIRKGASIGANATILCGIEIGQYAFIGAGAVVTKNVLPYSLLTGNPAKQIDWMSENGSRLKFDKEGKAVCSESGEKYFLKNGVVNKAY
jgi:UDP-2-acetamido-3-amino-2,3-dideoxy-glucuronate N-acetyltransferase